jgi:hypothetical protein
MHEMNDTGSRMGILQTLQAKQGYGVDQTQAEELGSPKQYVNTQVSSVA